MVGCYEIDSLSCKRRHVRNRLGSVVECYRRTSIVVVARYCRGDGTERSVPVIVQVQGHGRGGAIRDHSRVDGNGRLKGSLWRLGRGLGERGIACNDRPCICEHVLCPTWTLSCDVAICHKESSRRIHFHNVPGRGSLSGLECPGGETYGSLGIVNAGDSASADDWQPSSEAVVIVSVM